MHAVAFDLTVAETQAQHPKGVRQACDDIGDVLGQHGFRRVQGSLYVTHNEDMAKLFVAIQMLKALSWFPASVRDIRPFRVEQWSDFTEFVKTPDQAPTSRSEAPAPR